MQTTRAIANPVFILHQGIDIAFYCAIIVPLLSCVNGS